ncbi:Uncharacterised protein [Leclercia adecarboxylata]|uniref:Uncharacterized protein n=1 Tax=Leclercia adecarboxylata TaxID=83655 RepID=A0A4U9IDV3_9ENTR|nr:Uncharacterised protein [Leclercia adecarboxylata]
MTIAAAKAMVVATVIITDTKKAPRGAFFIIPLQCQSAAHRFSATTSTTIAHPARLTITLLTRSPHQLFVTGEHQQRHQRQRNTKAQQHLAHHQDAGRIQPHQDHNKGRAAW